MLVTIAYLIIASMLIGAGLVGIVLELQREKQPCPCPEYKWLIEHHKEHHAKEQPCPVCGGSKRVSIGFGSTITKKCPACNTEEQPKLNRKARETNPYDPTEGPR